MSENQTPRDEFDSVWRDTRKIQAKHRDFYEILGGTLLVLIGIAIGFVLFKPGTGFEQNLWTTIIGVVATVLVLDRRVEQRQRAFLKAQLIRELGSTDNGIARRAMVELEAHKWGFGEDESLRKAFLSGTNLADHSLFQVNFEEANLNFAKLVPRHSSK